MCGKRSLLESVANVGLNIATAGQLGMDAEGKVNMKSGAVGHAEVYAGKDILQGMKVLTGAQAAEDTLNQTKLEYQNQQAAALKDRADAKTQAGINDMTKSKMASAVRNSTGSTSNNNQSRYASNLGGDERDFLGL